MGQVAGKNNEKNIIKNIYTTKLDNNFLLNKYFCKSVGKDSQNFISKRNFTGISLNQGNKSENSHEKIILIQKMITKIIISIYKIIIKISIII